MPADTPLAELEFPGGRSFQVVHADLLKETTDGIVNAANNQLAHGGGVAGVIACAAGPEFDVESRRLVERDGRVPTGLAALTGAGRLRFKGVIHAVGPRQGVGNEEKKLVAAMTAALRVAHDQGWQSLSFPAVSAGIYAVPPDVCARAYVRSVRDFFATHPDSPVKLLRLCVFPGPIADAVVHEVRG
jgi:O-acetyl-ADP-ribose deacetylase (regulator of RNase III)